MSALLALLCLSLVPGEPARSLAKDAFYATGQSGSASCFIDPEGKPFWSFGVDCVEPGTPWESYKPENDAYRAYKLFPGAKAWTLDTISKLESWGFNSLGGWSDTTLFDRYAPKERLPYFVVLHLGAYDQAPWHDMFARQFEKAVDDAAKEQIPKLAKDPKLVGYFSDNELGWWGDTLFKSYFSMPGSSPGKQRLVKLFRDHYSDDFSRLREEWSTPAKTFDEFASTTRLYLRAGGSGMSVVNEWLSMLGTRYYSLMRDTIRRYDRSHLILGDRYCQYYNLEIAKSSAPYIDVASTNLGAEWNDGSISQFFLDTLHRATGKPVIITEFYLCAMENRSGNRNSSGGFPIVQTQAERATAFKKYVESVAALPFVIGAHWFQFTDEPAKGRGDGENYNMGLLDIHGKPYEELTEAAAGLDFGSLRVRSAANPPSMQAVPAAPSRVMEDLKFWPKSVGWAPSNSELPMANLYACRDQNYLYLGLFAMDFVDESLYEGERIPESERPLWKIEIGNHPIEIRYGGSKRPASCSDSSVKVAELAGLKHSVLAKVPLPKENAIDLASEWFSHSRGESTSWKVRLVLGR